MRHVRRRAVVDEYVEDGRVAIYSEQGLVMVLSELAGVAWLSVGADWMPAAAVAEVLVEQFGAPPGDGAALDATEAVLAELATHGLVELNPPA